MHVVVLKIEDIDDHKYWPNIQSVLTELSESLKKDGAQFDGMLISIDKKIGYAFKTTMNAGQQKIGNS